MSEFDGDAVEIDPQTSPNTREVLLEGLRQALQARVISVWTNVTLAGEPNAGPRFATGLASAIEFYEKAWHYIIEMTADD